MEVIIKPSHQKGKKFDAVINGTKTISFGAKGNSDFTMHNDVARKARYLKRHEKNESWNDPQTAGFYATHALWNKPTLKESIADINRKFPQVKVRLARNS